MVSSETCGLDIIGASYEDDVEPGELVTFRLDTQPTREQWAENVDPAVRVRNDLFRAPRQPILW